LRKGGIPLLRKSWAFSSTNNFIGAMKLFGQKKRAPELVTTGRFELERDGQVAYLQYTITGHILELLHSEIPDSMRGSGVASTLSRTALDWARQNNMKVDVVCPFVAGFLRTHPEYSDLVLS
jgi:predicted GNAT family acetyltransferase